MPTNQMSRLSWSRRANGEPPSPVCKSLPNDEEFIPLPPAEAGDPTGVPGNFVPEGEAVGVIPAVGVGCPGVGVGRAGVGVGGRCAGVDVGRSGGVLRGPGLFDPGATTVGAIEMETAAWRPLPISRACIWCGPADQSVPWPSQRLTAKRPEASACTVAGWPR